MTHGPTALYDDLAIEPNAEFERTLRRRLDHDLRGVRAQPFVEPVEIDLDMLPPAPEPSERDERGRSRRSIIAVAAAIAASIAVGVIVDRLVADDSTDAPAATLPTVPADTLPPATVEPPTGDAPATTAPLFTPDEIVAIKTLLWDADYDLPGFTHVGGAPVKLDGLVADRLPACQRFVATVFESEDRPAAIQSRLFQDQGRAWREMQYVAVHPTVAQATEMLDEMQDPAFIGECVPAYVATLPTECCNDVQSWFPFFTGDEEMSPPTIDVDADDMWVRRYNFVNRADGEGRIHTVQLAFAAIRVGRVVTTIDVMLSDNGVQLATTSDFERIVQHMAARAAAAQ